MRELLRKYEAEEAIVDAAVQRLRSRILPNKPLVGIREVMRGDYDGMPDPPCIWLIDSESRASGGTMVSAEYELDLMVQSQVKNIDSVQGSKDARKYASIASEELLRDDLGNADQRLGLPNVVSRMSIVRSERGPMLDQTSYTFLAVVRVTFSAKG